MPKTAQPNGRLIYACLDLIKAAIIDLDELKSYREVLETQVSFGVTLQTIVSINTQTHTP
eukprot:1341877-Amorphochlora_amoeboformis.AAC.1